MKISYLFTTVLLWDYLKDLSKALCFVQNCTLFRFITKTSIIISQFNYCPLVRMLCSKTSNKAIKKINERTLWITLDTNINSFVELVTRSQDMTNHYRKTQSLMTKLFKVVNNLPPPIMGNFLTIRDNH